MYSLFNMAKSDRSTSPPPHSAEFLAGMAVLANAPMRPSKRSEDGTVKETYTRSLDFKPKVFKPRPDDGIPDAPKKKKGSKSRISKKKS